MRMAAAMEGATMNRAVVLTHKSEFGDSGYKGYRGK